MHGFGRFLHGLPNMSLSTGLLDSTLLYKRAFKGPFKQVMVLNLKKHTYIQSFFGWVNVSFVVVSPFHPFVEQ